MRVLVSGRGAGSLAGVEGYRSLQRSQGIPEHMVLFSGLSLGPEQVTQLLDFPLDAGVRIFELHKAAFAEEPRAFQSEKRHDGH